MSRTVTVGIDGSSESLAAAEWAAREAGLRRRPLRLVNVWEAVPEPMGKAPLLGPDAEHEWRERVPREAADGIRARHPGVEVVVEQVSGRAAAALAEAARDAEPLVLGSRGLGGVGGFLIGSVGLSVIAHTEAPVVLVRAGEQAADEHVRDPAGIPSAAAPYRPVVLGLDTDGPDDTLIGFAFDAAARRDTALRVVHAWNPPAHFTHGGPEHREIEAQLGRWDAAMLAEVLDPWKQKVPTVQVVEESRPGKAAHHLVEASHEASLVVVGRRIRRSPLGAHVGPVTHAVLHHATAPVAVVAHG
ncbi:universal stress protein [Streptomyces phyllanthi]|uniref:Universal stress protein n=1 Tax=Streptomyces phyllanthi TaxID=1803180 RepID=A0A5N8WDP1_9ACTN|nr:universal stress protein [Streptomyces phyllanthi]MPY45517.1 universal stress protein [Streptomyces phyllanthi]